MGINFRPDQGISNILSNKCIHKSGKYLEEFWRIEMSLWNWNLGVILFTGFIRIVLQQERVLNPQCSPEVEPRATMRCGHLDPLGSPPHFNVYVIPDNLDKNIEGLILSPGPNAHFIIFNITAERLLKYPNLRRLVITQSSHMHGLGCNEQIYADVFKDLTSLESLEFTKSTLETSCKIPLPKNLIKIDLSFNSYEQVDLHWCPKLEEINLEHNKMMYMPTLHNNSLPLLKKLNLMGNHMGNMTILDIAPLCNLTSLELNGVPGLQEDELNNKGFLYYCQCETFINWTKEYNISGLQLECKRPKDVITNADCWNAKKQIDAAKKIRQEQCSPEQSSTMPSAKGSISDVIKIAFIIFLGLLLIALFLYTISRLVLRKKPPDEYVVNEEAAGEEEEELVELSDTPGKTDSRYAGQDEKS